MILYHMIWTKMFYSVVFISDNMWSFIRDRHTNETIRLQTPNILGGAMYSRYVLVMQWIQKLCIYPTLINAWNILKCGVPCDIQKMVKCITELINYQYMPTKKIKTCVYRLKQNWGMYFDLTYLVLSVLFLLKHLLVRPKFIEPLLVYFIDDYPMLADFLLRKKKGNNSYKYGCVF
jgi:hypothetical protein